MERNMVLAVIFSAAAVVGAIETVYQVYQLTVIDAAARGACLRRTGIIQVDCCYI